MLFISRWPDRNDANCFWKGLKDPSRWELDWRHPTQTSASFRRRIAQLGSIFSIPHILFHVVHWRFVARDSTFRNRKERFEK